MFTDQSGENPITLLSYAIVAVFTYFKTAHDNRDTETGKWAWNPMDWFKKGNNTTFIIGVSTNSSFSSFTGYAGMGSDFSVPAISYNTQHGIGFGNATNPGFNDFYYANYTDEASVINAIQNINKLGGTWDGIYFVGTEEEAILRLITDSKFFNVETTYYSTTRGFYFEPVQGNILGYSYDELTRRTLKYNIAGEYQTNTIRAAFRYTRVDNIEGNPYIFSDNMFNKARVYYQAHSHPMNSSNIGSDDLQFSFFLGIRCKVFGWNGRLLYEIGGPGYWN
jgi:hypothetical protein